MTMLLLLQLAFAVFSGAMWNNTGDAEWAFTCGGTCAFAFSMALDMLLKRRGLTRL